MNELIKLTSQEMLLQEADLRFTLKEVADKYGKENGKLVKSFKNEVSKLTDCRINTFNYWLDSVATQTITNINS